MSTSWGAKSNGLMIDNALEFKLLLDFAFDVLLLESLDLLVCVVASSSSLSEADP